MLVELPTKVSYSVLVYFVNLYILHLPLFFDQWNNISEFSDVVFLSQIYKENLSCF